jgi:hypothetical protein
MFALCSKSPSQTQTLSGWCAIIWPAIREAEDSLREHGMPFSETNLNC